MENQPSRNENQDRTHSGLSFLEFYSGYVTGLRKGNSGNYSGYCPIHGEEQGRSTPSLSVNVENGLWYCFAGCGGGAPKSFLQALGESKRNVAKVLRELGPTSPRRGRVPRTRTEDLILPEKLLGVFDECPLELTEAGFDWRILQDHDIGYDRALRRITFPIRSSDGKLVGITGKCEDASFGKYRPYTRELATYGFKVDSFNKTDYLWREDKVREYLATHGARESIFVVEGFKAALWLVQSGIQTVVALMGSYLSDTQKKRLERLGNRIILCLDNDPPGRKASIASCKKLNSTVTLVAPLPPGQPDDFSEDEILEICNSPISIKEAQIQWEEERRPSPPVPAEPDEEAVMAGKRAGETN